MADGELTAREAERVMWDVIVVGTGMGGGMLGYSAGPVRPQSALRRKGTLDTAWHAGNDPRCHAGTGRAAGGPVRRGLLRCVGPGRTLHRRDRRHQRTIPAPVCAVHWQRHRRILGAVRHGLRAILRRDFTPRQNFRNPGDSTVPEAWPVTYDQMRPWYAQAEKLLGVRGQPDPLRPEAAEVNLPAAPPFSADNQPLVKHFDGSRIASLSPADGL